jgi:hypothetical protein
MKTCAIGIRVHSGWGALVAASGGADDVEVIDRRRVDIIDRKAAGAAQPYHYAKNLGPAAAEKYIVGSALASAKLALAALKEVSIQLHDRGYRVGQAVVLLSSGRPLPELEKILASHAMIHTAEGEFFRQAFREAFSSLKIPVIGVRKRDLDERAKTTFSKEAPGLKKRIDALGKTLGPPWTADQKAATLAAVIALAELAE